VALQLALVPENLTPITEGIYSAIVQATDDRDQSESNLIKIEESFRRLSVNCSGLISEVF